jgi:hypothetical protein
MAYDVHVEESIDITAPPDLVYATIVDVANWGRFSPECTGASCSVDGQQLRVGSRFSGRNRRGVRRWTTHCVVTAADAGKLFEFNSGAIGLDIATWRYELESTADGTRVTEIWHDNRGPLMRAIAVVVSGIRDRATHNRQSMQVTLRRLKEHLEEQPVR